MLIKQLGSCSYNPVTKGAIVSTPNPSFGISTNDVNSMLTILAGRGILSAYFAAAPSIFNYQLTFYFFSTTIYFFL